MLGAHFKGALGEGDYLFWSGFRMGYNTKTALVVYMDHLWETQNEIIIGSSPP